MSTRRNQNYRVQRMFNKVSRKDRDDVELNDILSYIHMGIAGCCPSMKDNLEYLPYRGSEYHGQRKWRYKVKQSRAKLHARFSVRLNQEDSKKLLETGKLGIVAVTRYIRQLQTDLANEKVFRITDVDLSGHWTPVSLIRHRQAYLAVTHLADGSTQLIQLSTDTRDEPTDTDTADDHLFSF